MRPHSMEAKWWARQSKRNYGSRAYANPFPAQTEMHITIASCACINCHEMTGLLRPELSAPAVAGVQHSF
ncbi:hypothetical protein TNCV_1720781 [Trichonephila clavipes]|nr:hypothetical protein TNCV_1720781 [Trichonephila clavipes]